jgi:hypothetical protein
MLSPDLLSVYIFCLITTNTNFCQNDKYKLLIDKAYITQGNPTQIPYLAPTKPHHEIYSHSRSGEVHWCNLKLKILKCFSIPISFEEATETRYLQDTGFLKFALRGLAQSIAREQPLNLGNRITSLGGDVLINY